VDALQLTGHGISTDLPDGWEGRISRRVEPGPGARSPVNGADLSVERTHPVVHLANFALPEDRGDFGSGAVELMGGEHLFVCLFEFGPESVGTALFAADGMPRTLDPASFSSAQLQRTIQGQAGYQTFFTEAGRPFTLFVALGSGRRAAELVPRANAVLAATSIEAR
jgi:hypothetical protein